MIRHVLLDADGVLQVVPDGGQTARAVPYLGSRRDVLDAIFEAEKPSLRGESDFRVDLERTLAEHGVQVDVDAFYADLWLAIEVVPEVADVARRLRAAGYGVHLGTNQHRQRGLYMRHTVGYDDLLDVGCYSWELGAVKPEAAFFERAVALVGAPAAEVLFVDDAQRHVDGARDAGLAAERWEVGDGVPALLDLLARHGVELA